MRFYELAYDVYTSNGDYYMAEEVSERDEIVGSCPAGKGHPCVLRKKEGDEAILTIDIPSPKMLEQDFLCTDYEWDYIIPERVAQLFKEAGFTGYELKPVRINEIKRLRKPMPIPTLWELVIKGFAGIPHPDSGIRLKSWCKECGYLRFLVPFPKSPHLIDTSLWDGSDFFWVCPLQKYIFVTERVKDVIEGNGLKGCRFIPMEEVKLPEKDVGARTTSLLSRLSEEQALSLSKLLNIPLIPKEEIWRKAIPRKDLKGKGK
ncbi:MAG: double-CXXCG motif protein [bacterium]